MWKEAREVADGKHKLDNGGDVGKKGGWTGVSWGGLSDIECGC